MDDQQLQRLFLGLLGDLVRATVTKDAEAILKGVGKVLPPAMPVRPGSTVRRPVPNPGRAQVQCFRCLRTYRLGVPCLLPTSQATVWSWSCWTVVSSASVFNTLLFPL